MLRSLVLSVIVPLALAGCQPSATRDVNDASAGAGSTRNAGPDTDPDPGVHAGRSATFDARHDFEIPVPAGTKRLRAWFAMPSEIDRFQTVSSWTVEAPYATRIVHDNWGNNFLYMEASSPPAGLVAVQTHFRLTRREVNADLDPSRTRPHTAEELETLTVYLKGSSESVIDADARAMAEKAVGGERNPILASRKIYDAVLAHVDYHVKDPKPDAEKTMTSTGTGSSRKCYATRCGNCTDFHSLYAAVSRAAGIPTRAVYGSFFKGPLDGKESDQSYHCWIEFHAPDVGWIPLDVAVADIFVEDFAANEHSKPRANLTVANGYDGPDPALVTYYFGNLEPRRVTWHRCRDLVMTPTQDGKPLLWNPKAYVELDGKPAAVRRILTYREVK